MITFATKRQRFAYWMTIVPVLVLAAFKLAGLDVPPELELVLVAVFAAGFLGLLYTCLVDGEVSVRKYVRDSVGKSLFILALVLLALLGSLIGYTELRGTMILFLVLIGITGKLFGQNDPEAK